MTISLEYIGAAERYFETASTGKSQSWRRGQTQDVSDTDAALLMATGLFAYGSADAQPESNIAPGFPVTATTNLTGGSRIPLPIRTVNGVAIENSDIQDLFFYRRSGDGATLMSKMLNGNHASINPYAAINGYIVHPAVVYVPEGFAGYKYWCAYTPMTNNQSQYENPCIVASDDMTNWVSPAVNPIFPWPGGGAFNSDTHLILSPDRKSLILLYRTFAEGTPARHRLKVSTCTDGKTWSSPVEIWSCLQSSNQDMTSPSLWYDSTSSMWYIVGTDYPNPATGRVLRMSSPDLFTGWPTDPTPVTMTPPSGRQWWHSYFTRLSTGKIVGFVQDTATQAAPGNLYLAESNNNGLTWSYSLFDSTWLYYRSCLFSIERNGQIELYGVYSCTSLDYIGVQKLALASVSSTSSQDAATLGDCISSASVCNLKSILLADNFKRADSDVSLGTTVNGLTWSQIDVGNILGIASNGAYNTTANVCGAVIDVATNRYQALLSVKTKGTEYWLIVGYVDSLNYCRIGCSSATAGKITFQQISAGSTVVNAVLNLFTRDGDIIRADVSGHYCNVYLRGELAYRARNMVSAAATKVGLLAAGAVATAFNGLSVSEI